MKMTSLKVSTPEGSSGSILTSREDFIFYGRYLRRPS